MVDKLVLKPDSKLYKFLKNGKREKIPFDAPLFKEALILLSKINDPDVFFEFEDRLISEIIDLAREAHPELAKQEIARIRQIVESHVEHANHVTPFLISIRNCIKSASKAAIYCIS